MTNTALSTPAERDLDIITPEAMTELAKTQRAHEAILERRLTEFSKLLIVLDENNRSLKKLIESRLTVTGAQAKVLQTATVTRAHEVCKQNRLEYAACGGKIRNAIRKAVKDEYTVSEFCDLPAVSFDSAMELIQEWMSFDLIRRLREK